MKTNDVFGISPKVRDSSYIDRGKLDEEVKTYLNRHTHIALRGESKCGKSWLRQNTIPNALIVQCRLSKSVTDIYIDALSQLEVKLEASDQSKDSISGSITATGEAGVKLLAKAGLSTKLSANTESQVTSKTAGHDINDLRYVVEIIKASGRTLVVEDFHYMTIENRQLFAFDLKAMWDYELFVVIIGVWSQTNMLLYLNPDLTGRVREIAIEWTTEDLIRILEKGGHSLKIDFSDQVKKLLANLSFSNAGILQQLALLTLDSAKITESGFIRKSFTDSSHVENAALEYAEQLNALYQSFADNVSSGIRSRTKSTGIYAHTMAVILEMPEEDLIRGVKVDVIFKRAHERQKRIQLGNLKAVLEKIESLQVDKDGRGLVLSYNRGYEQITVVDKQLLLYKKYCTVKWPWESLISEATSDSAYET